MTKEPSVLAAMLEFDAADANNAINAVAYDMADGISVAESVTADINFILFNGVGDNQWAIY